MSENTIIIQACDSAQFELADVVVPRMKDYAWTMGYDHEFVKVTDAEDHDFNYRKYTLLNHFLSLHKHYKVVWADIDVIPLERKHIPQFIGEFATSQDRWGHCAGFISVTSTLWSRWFVELLLEIIPKKGRYRLEEQETLTRLIQFPEIVKHTQLIPEEVVGHRDTVGVTSRSTFIHLWANSNLASAIRDAKVLCSDWRV